MRKILSLICIIVLGLVPVAYAAGTSAIELTLNVGESSAEPGQRVVVPIIIEVNPGIAALDLNIEYDSTRLQFDGVTNGTALEGLNFTPPNLRFPHTVSWISFEFLNSISTGLLTELEFTVLPSATAGSAYISVAGFAFAVNSSGEDLVNVIVNESYLVVLRVAPPRRPSDSAGHWSEDYIEQVTDAGVMTGYPDGTFQPDNAITRAEFAAVFVRFLGDAAGVATFDDTIEHWARGYIAAIADRGAVMGVGNNMFAPDSLITREQIATILYRTFEFDDFNPESTLFAGDIEISYWAANAVYAVRAAGIMTGDSAGGFNPQETATRAEVAAIFTRI